METPFRRIVFLAIQPGLDRELFASIIATDPETLICKFEPDGTEATLWIAIHEYFHNSQGDTATGYVALTDSVENSEVASRLLTEFPMLCVLLFNKREQTVHKHFLCLHQTKETLNLDSLSELWERLQSTQPKC